MKSQVLVVYSEKEVLKTKIQIANDISYKQTIFY